MAIYAWDLIGRKIELDFYYEREELELSWAFLSPFHEEFLHGEFLDIGANIRNHSRFFRDKFKKIHAFEPHPDTFDLLRFNMKYMDNSKIYNFGLGNESASCKITNDNRRNMGAAKIANDANANSLEVEIRPLDELSFDNISLVKIDVEGFEEKVITGGIKNIKRHRPVILFEQNSDAFIGGSSPSLEKLKSLDHLFVWQNNPRTRLEKRINNLKKRFSKRKLFSGGLVPPCEHRMIIAVPSEKFCSLEAPSGSTR